MNDYRYDRVNSLAAHDAARKNLAALMAEYEQRNGPVVTTPIQIRSGSARADVNARARERARRRQTPQAKRGTRQAKKNAVLREEWL